MGLVADRARSPTRELWQFMTLDKAFLLTKTASCPNSALLMMGTRGQSLALELIYVKLVHKWY